MAYAERDGQSDAGVACSVVPISSHQRMIEQAATIISAIGTFLTCRVALTMSVDRGKADFALGLVEV